MRIIYRLNAFFIYLFLYAPILILILFSFNNSQYTVAWEGFSLQWYDQLFHNPAIWEKCLNSLVVALATTVISTILGTTAVLALERYKFVGQSLYAAVLYLPIIVPDIVLAIALSLFYGLTHIPRGFATIIFGHVVLTIPFVAIVVRARLRGFDRNLEEASADLGANEWATLRYVTLPLIAPGILGGALLAFSLSIDDFIITFFTKGIGVDTLPIQIYSMQKKFGVTPEINAVSSLLLFNSILFVLLSLTLQRRK